MALRRRTMIALALCAIVVGGAAGLLRRSRVIGEYRNFAGDGRQYFRLAETLHGEHRYAFGAKLPPAWSRLPGYPIFLAITGHNVDKFDADGVGFQAARAQILLDVLTALLAFGLAWELGLRVSPWLAYALCLGSPLLILSDAYILTESLTIVLTTATLWLLLRATRVRPLLHCSIAGVLVGLGLLVRADTVTILPCFVVPLVYAPGTRHARVQAVLAAAVCALVVFAPWPLRNLARFGRAYPFGASWVSKLGDPLPTGIQDWLRTWAVDPRAATVDIAWRVTRGDPLEPQRLPADANDGKDERKAVEKLFAEYNKRGLVPSVDEGFAKLAATRRARDPARFWLTLPLARAWVMWHDAVPDWEMPCASPTLELPAKRAGLDPLVARSGVLACLGLLLLAIWRRGRRLALLALVAAGVRTALIALVVPGGTERYLFELLPLELVLASVALFAPAELILRRLGSRRPAA